MKKVLYIATVVKTHINEFHLPYIKRFSDLGWQVDVAAKNDFLPKTNLEIPNCTRFWDIPFVRSPFSLENIKSFNLLKTILNKEKYDLIVCNTPMGGVIGRLAAKDVENTKIVYIAHGFHFFKGNVWYKNMIFYNAEKIMARYTDCLITINDEDYNAAQKFKLRNLNQVYKIDGIGCNIKSNTTDKINMRKELGIREDEFVVITVAEMIPRKNYITAIKAFARANISNSKYLIVGNGRQEHELKKLTRLLRIEDKVKFLGYRNDIANLLNASNVLLFPTLQEGLGMAIIEAMSVGLPVLVSKVRGPLDCIVQNRSGFAYNPNDIEGFADGLLKIHNMSDEEIQRISKFNKNHAKKFSITNVIEEMFEIYKRSGVI